MQTRYFALVVGIVFVLIGVLGFVPGITADPPATARELEVEANYGYLLGLFPVNVLHNLVHLLFGVAGIVAYRTYRHAKLYAQALAVIYVVLAIFGLIPDLRTLFGLVPLFGHDIWLHALLALGGAYFGFIHKERNL